MGSLVSKGRARVAQLTICVNGPLAAKAFRRSDSMKSRVYLADILDRIHDHKIKRLDELLPAFS